MKFMRLAFKLLDYISLYIIIMSAIKNKKVNSDLSQVLSIMYLRKVTDQTDQIRTIGRLNNTYLHTQSSSNKTIQSPQSPKKQQTSTVISQIKKLVHHYYSDDSLGFFMRARKYLKEDWTKQKKLFNVHLNKILYIEKTMYKNTFMEIQVEVLKEWKKSPILYELRLQWYEAVKVFQFQNFDEFIKQYQKFCQFLGQLTYLYFKGFFTIISTKINADDSVLDRLVNRTSHFIITQSSMWTKLYNKHLKKFIVDKKNQEYKFVQDFDLSVLNISPYAFNLQSQEFQLPETGFKIHKFIQECNIFQKMLLLKDIRETLEDEITSWQKILIQQKQLSEYEILAKDDFIGCFIYVVVKGKIPLNELGTSIRMFFLLLQEQCNNILSKWECDSYLADLESVYEHLMEVLKKRQSINATQVY